MRIQASGHACFGKNSTLSVMTEQSAAQIEMRQSWIAAWNGMLGFNDAVTRALADAHLTSRVVAGRAEPKP